MDKIICIGKNYAEHAKELGEAQPEKPVIFLKPPSVLKQAHAWDETITATFPTDDEVVPECELVLQVGKDGASISAVTVGLDVTLRARQRTLKQLGQPWTTAKVFSDAAIAGPWVSVADFPAWQTALFSASLNDEKIQAASSADMLYAPAFLLTYVAQFFPLCPGDMIFTGTPKGLRNIHAGDTLSLALAGKQFFVRWQVS